MTRSAFRFAITLLLYVATGRFCMMIGAVESFAAPVWFPAGIAVASIVLYGYWIWPATLAGAMIVNLWIGASYYEALAIGLGNSAEALVSAMILLRAFRFDCSLRSLRDGLAFVAVSLVGGTLISPTVGALALWWGGKLPSESIELAWVTWWIGDALGYLVIAPLLFTWLRAARWRPSSAARALESLALATVLILTAMHVFCGFFEESWPRYLAQAYFVFPAAIWAALRFGPQGSSAASFVLLVFAAWGALKGTGPYALSATGDNLLPLQFFMGILSSTSIILAAVTQERTLASRRAEENSTMLSAYFANAPVGLGFLDTELRYQKINDELATLNGIPAAEHLGKPLRQMLPKVANELEDLLTQVMRSRQPAKELELSAEVPRRPGQVVHFVAHYFPVETPRGQLLGVGAMVADITERREAKKQRFLAKIGNVLSSSLRIEDLLSRIAWLLVPGEADWCMIKLGWEGAPNIPLTYSYADPDTGRAMNNLLSRYPADIMPWSRLYHAIHTGQRTLVKEVSDTDYDRSAINPEHAQLLKKVGTHSMLFVPIFGNQEPPQGRKVLGAIGLGMGPSGRKYGEEDVRRAEEVAALIGAGLENARLYGEAQEAIRIREETLSTVSHDLRSPLTSITVTADLLSKLTAQGIDPGQFRHQTEIILRSANYMARLIQDLLDITKLEAGNLKLKLEPRGVRSVIESALELLSAEAKAKDISLECDAPAGAERIRCDEKRILQALMNMIGNALKFTPAGGRITIRAERWETRPGSGEDRIRFSVRDTGPGISERDLPLIFKRHWQTDKNAHQGAGLGLAIAKGIIEAHGGQIWAESKPRAGSTFSFWLEREKT